MKGKSIQLNTYWYTADGKGEMSDEDYSGELERHEIPLGNGAGEGWIERLPLSLGFVLARREFWFSRNLDIKSLPSVDLFGEFSEPSLVARAMPSGRTLLRDRNTDQEFWNDPNESIFLYADRLDCTLQLDPSASATASILLVGESVLQKLMGKRLCHTIMTGLAITEKPSAVSVKIPPEISSHLHASVAAGLHGDLRLVEAQASVLDYLGALAAHLGGHGKHDRISKKDQLAIQLRDELMSFEGKVPRLDELAERYGVSARTLNDTFKGRFGKTVREYIMEHRLNQAHVALRTSEIPIKQLAFRFGYSQAHHFTTAFTKKFGYSPSACRRGGGKFLSSSNDGESEE